MTDSGHYVTGYRRRPPREWRGTTSSRFVSAQLGINTANTHAASHAPTAIAATARLFLGVKPTSPSVSGSLKLVLSMRPAWDAGGGGRMSQLDCYYWYYGTLAAFQAGGAQWTQWNTALKTALLARQRTRGCVAGSWDPITAWSFGGGRIYVTALNALSLQVYYRYPRLHR